MLRSCFKVRMFAFFFFFFQAEDGIRDIGVTGVQTCALPISATPDDLVVHQQDVQAVVNALWVGGAEAMMLMDQRVISTSAVRCVGNTLLLQGRVYSPPYRITAIGDPARMRAALETPAALQIYREFAREFGLGWTVQDAGELTVPAFTGSLDLRYATPLPTPS